MNIEELKKEYEKYIDLLHELAPIRGEKSYFCALKEGYATLSGWVYFTMPTLKDIEFYLKSVKNYYENYYEF